MTEYLKTCRSSRFYSLNIAILCLECGEALVVDSVDVDEVGGQHLGHDVVLPLLGVDVEEALVVRAGGLDVQEERGVQGPHLILSLCKGMKCITMCSNCSIDKKVYLLLIATYVQKYRFTI